ncbi:MAG: hypothetical protein Q4G52_00445 [Clostridia bacterium]|nr:hypothetical protein [Clostridia bacterium]
MSRNESAQSGAIRLTNRTARALRRCAQRERSVCRAAVVILTLGLAVSSVALGVVWLPAVPLMLLAAAIVDALLLVYGRSRYLSLIGQAICTEAAARGIRDQGNEKRRRRQALSDLAGIREDMKRMTGEEAAEEDDDLLPALELRAKPEGRPEAARAKGEDTKRVQRAQAPARRRRRQAAFQVLQSEQTDAPGGVQGDAEGWQHKARH